MIKKERLEKLIKEKATVWHNDYGEIPLNETSEICKCYYMNNKFSHFVICGQYEDYKYELDIRELEEDVESAKWHDKMDCQRIDRLTFPIYKDFIKNYQTLGENLIEDDKCIMFTSKTQTYSLYATDDEIWVGQDGTGKRIFNDKLNQENYEKACDICRKLFLGE